MQVSANDGSIPFDLRVPSTFKKVVVASIGTIKTVWTPATGKKIRLLGGSFSVSVATSVLFEDHTAAAGNFVYQTPKLLQDTPYPMDLGPKGVLLSAEDHVLKATAADDCTITGTLWGVEE